MRPSCRLGERAPRAEDRRQASESSCNKCRGCASHGSSARAQRSSRCRICDGTTHETLQVGGAQAREEAALLTGSSRTRSSHRPASRPACWACLRRGGTSTRARTRTWRRKGPAELSAGEPGKEPRGSAGHLLDAAGKAWAPPAVGPEQARTEDGGRLALGAGDESLTSATVDIAFAITAANHLRARPGQQGPALLARCAARLPLSHRPAPRTCKTSRGRKRPPWTSRCPWSPLSPCASRQGRPAPFACFAFACAAELHRDRQSSTLRQSQRSRPIQGTQRQQGRHSQVSLPTAAQPRAARLRLAAVCRFPRHPDRSQP